MDGETPGSIPNPEAKPVSTDGTARATGWESRSPPNIHSWVAVIHARPATADAGHGRPPPSTLPPTTHTPRRRARPPWDLLCPWSRAGVLSHARERHAVSPVGIVGSRRLGRRPRL